MEKGLLARSVHEEAKAKIDNGLADCTPNGSQATIVTVLSTMVDLFGSLGTGCLVSILLTHDNSVSWKYITFWLKWLLHIFGIVIIHVVILLMQKGYSSPAESGIMEDLELSIADKYQLASR